MPYDAPVIPSSIIPPVDLYDPGGGGRRTLFYRLYFKRHKAVSMREYGQWESRNPLGRRIGDAYKNGVRVSTVFLMIDHAFRGPPVLYESMIFGGKRDQEQWRHRTYGEARSHFMRLCRTVFGMSPGVNRAYMLRPKVVRVKRFKLAKRGRFGE